MGSSIPSTLGGCLEPQLPGDPVQVPVLVCTLHTEIHSHTLVKIRKGNTL